VRARVRKGGLIMKILHVLNTAGVASIIGKYMDRLFDTKSCVVTRKCQDKFGLTTYGEYWDCDTWAFLGKIIFESRHHDIIHLHDRDILLPLLKQLYPNKPLIMHYHGTKIRGQWHKRKKYWKYADQILVVTPDLLKGAPKNAELVLNPVDKTLFFSQGNNNAPRAVHFKYRVDEIAREIAEKHNLSLLIHDRKRNPIPHIKMPAFLSEFTHLIDVKKDVRGNLLSPPDTTSKTSLEALACGLKVIPYKGNILRGLPYYNEPEFVVSRIYGIYQEMLSKKEEKKQIKKYTKTEHSQNFEYITIPQV